jgi:hypothetical protein
MPSHSATSAKFYNILMRAKFNGQKKAAPKGG